VNFSVKIFYFFFIAFLVINVIKLFSFSQPPEDGNKCIQTYHQRFNDNYKIYAVPIPHELHFAGERVPLERFDVYEALDREFLVNTYWQSQTMLFIKRANRYFPVIEPILKANGVPDDFKYMALIESGLKNVVSPMGATGYWQFMKGAARDYGLEVNSEIDERYHIEKSTEAACNYILESYRKYGSWTMAAASYNVGRKGVSRQINRQKEETFYDLLLNEETSRYLYRTLAVKCILEKPDKYGFHFREYDLYPEIPKFKVKVDSSVTHWADFADKFSTNYKILKYFNPWLRQSYLKNPKKKTYYITLPEKGARDIYHEIIKVKHESELQLQNEAEEQKKKDEAYEKNTIIENEEKINTPKKDSEKETRKTRRQKRREKKKKSGAGN
jgi:hypothetical protein